MDEEIIKKYSKETPLGWKVNLLNMLSTSLMTLADSIDADLRKIKTSDGSTLSFNKDKKRMYNMFCSCLEGASRQFKRGVQDAEKWYEKINIDGQVWKLVGEDAARYDNFTCDAKELLQVMLLYVDRAHSMEGFYSVMRHLRSLPEGGIFPDSEIERFGFKRPLVLCEGATIESQFGRGVIASKTNGDNWLIDMEDGTQRVLTSQMFKLTV